MSDNLTPAGLTVENASGPSSVLLPDGVHPVSYEPILVDDQGNVFFEVNLPTGGPAHTWRWSRATNSAGEMPGVGMPETGAAGTNLYWVDRGEIVWSNNIDGRRDRALQMEYHPKDPARSRSPPRNNPSPAPASA
jgi:hypothetical protein